MAYLRKKYKLGQDLHKFGLTPLEQLDLNLHNRFDKYGLYFEACWNYMFQQNLYYNVILWTLMLGIDLSICPKECCPFHFRINNCV